MDAREWGRQIRVPARQFRAGVVLGLGNQLGVLVRLYGGTDKWVHRYTPYYEVHFGPIRLRQLIVYEIGVGGYQDLTPGGSLAVWRDYFPRSTIVGIDIAEKVVDLGGNVRFERADQSSTSELQSVVERHGAPHVVIDDGSHVGEHTRASFAHLWPLMPPGSFYVIEDLSTSYYPDYGGADPAPVSSAVGLVADLVDCVQAEDPTFVLAPWKGLRSKPNYFGVAAVHVYPGITFIRKVAETV